jgi:hypothetical protein
VIPSGLVGKPDDEQDYVRFMAEDIEVYLSKEIWEGKYGAQLKMQTIRPKRLVGTWKRS